MSAQITFTPIPYSLAALEHLVQRNHRFAVCCYGEDSTVSTIATVHKTLRAAETKARRMEGKSCIQGLGLQYRAFDVVQEYFECRNKWLGGHDDWLCNLILSRANSYNGERIAGILAHKALREHRTIQQSLVRIMADFIKAYAKGIESHGTDLRNQGAAEWAAKVAEIEAALPYV